ncbi:uncharacterized protein At4g04775-like [Eutrema salsugineum]|uniref:uncharacterized protein At4g04775-like n=1 Tax=Eutrema salsugineum TaxID=72664 RepID=UPI000CED11DF|nr:uncharacterized protein At4g04775-like [Eutrema salsugineum]
MSGASSNVSEGSSGSSCGGPRRIVGVPKKCWCGEQNVALISKSDHNPYRRYYRCAFAASKKIVNDNHNFKWVDEALLDEIEKLQLKNSRLEQVLEELRATESMIFEKLEKEIFDKVEDVLVEASRDMKKMMLLGVVECLVVVGIMSLVG